MFAFKVFYFYLFHYFLDNTLSTNNFFSFFNFYNFEGTNKCHLCPKSGSGCHCYKRYYFHPKSGTCKMFYYRGCYGNANNFLTEDSCLKSCQNEGIIIFNNNI